MQPDISKAAALMGDRARSVMLMSLLGERALPATELAHLAKVRPQTASEHLTKLVDGGFVTCRQVGRHRYYSLTGEDVAEVLESLAAISPWPPARSLRMDLERRRLAFARLCYDHLAGFLGVSLADALVQQGWVASADHNFALTVPGRLALEDLGIDLNARCLRGRQLSRPCLDWSERRFHVAGAVGAALASFALKAGWVAKGPDPRSLSISDAGRKAFAAHFGLTVPDSAPSPGADS